MTSLISVNSTKVGHGTKGTYIIMQGDTIKSDSIYYYIGRTKNFIFFYNEKTKTTDIFPDKEITKVSLKDNGY